MLLTRPQKKSSRRIKKEVEFQHIVIVPSSTTEFTRTTEFISVYDTPVDYTVGGGADSGTAGSNFITFTGTHIKRGI